MKKVIASAVGLMLAGGVAATTASAVENQFGGYWRTRAYIQDNFDGTDSDTYDVIDTRTRLYYTAKFSDDFKFVNKFEYDAKWGGPKAGYGDIGTDGIKVEVKNSYADFNLGTVNFKVGAQGVVIARGFIFDDDLAGAVVTPKFGNVSMPLFYTRVSDVDNGGEAFEDDADLMGGIVSVKISDAFTLTPYFVYFTVGGAEDIDDYYIGADVDMNMDALSVWGTFIYNGGTMGDTDISAFLVAAGVDAGIAHGQAFYATGDDGSDATETNAFISAPGQSYYWSEIMGLGIFDNMASNGSCSNAITNVMALNAGVTLKPMDKLKVSADVWYAMLAEEDANGEDELGLEFDGQVTYALMDNLSLDAVLAYLVAGKATSYEEEDVMEAGVRLSLKF